MIKLNIDIIGKKVRMLAKPNMSANLEFDKSIGICKEINRDVIAMKLLTMPNTVLSSASNYIGNIIRYFLYDWDFEIINDDWDE